uniref:Uncharacterized protein n=1 Tax=Chromera velia CCMP2878 TaxID=1169474 RepID=A0A0G4G157_9ALVE|eukprot:Cvel_533.t1-p1 / transcript=Cvel_533.t1 / gene=Cvel_533 / organism=Chromera_velia_CCMP2878 / gene_product=hypothetical protein / transcript_product=hypothetical protein / location=Cvel_scaffold16:184054-187592(+) / protein_length=399 / sequence_SO=supercontig / SO=protein_coding / is_pseudo=false
MTLLLLLKTFFQLQFTFEEDCVWAVFGLIAKQHFGEVLYVHDEGALRGMLRALIQYAICSNNNNGTCQIGTAAQLWTMGECRWSVTRNGMCSSRGRWQRKGDDTLRNCVGSEGKVIEAYTVTTSGARHFGTAVVSVPGLCQSTVKILTCPLSPPPSHLSQQEQLSETPTLGFVSVELTGMGTRTVSELEGEGQPESPHRGGTEVISGDGRLSKQGAGNWDGRGIALVLTIDATIFDLEPVPGETSSRVFCRVRYPTHERGTGFKSHDATGESMWSRHAVGPQDFLILDTLKIPFESSKTHVLLEAVKVVDGWRPPKEDKRKRKKETTKSGENRCGGVHGILLSFLVFEALRFRFLPSFSCKPPHESNAALGPVGDDLLPTRLPCSMFLSGYIPNFSAGF